MNPIKPISKIETFKVKKITPIDTSINKEPPKNKPKTPIIFDSPNASPLDYLDEFGVPILRTRR